MAPLHTPRWTALIVALSVIFTGVAVVFYEQILDSCADGNCMAQMDGGNGGDQCVDPPLPDPNRCSYVQNPIDCTYSISCDGILCWTNMPGTPPPQCLCSDVLNGSCGGSSGGSMSSLSNPQDSSSASSAASSANSSQASSIGSSQASSIGSSQASSAGSSTQSSSTGNSSGNSSAASSQNSSSSSCPPYRENYQPPSCYHWECPADLCLPCELVRDKICQPRSSSSGRSTASSGSSTSNGSSLSSSSTSSLDDPCTEPSSASASSVTSGGTSSVAECRESDVRCTAERIGNTCLGWPSTLVNRQCPTGYLPSWQMIGVPCTKDGCNGVQYTCYRVASLAFECKCQSACTGNIPCDPVDNTGGLGGGLERCDVYVIDGSCAMPATQPYCSTNSGFGKLYACDPEQQCMEQSSNSSSAGTPVSSTNSSAFSPCASSSSATSGSSVSSSSRSSSVSSSKSSSVSKSSSSISASVTSASSAQSLSASSAMSAVSSVKIPQASSDALLPAAPDLSLCGNGKKDVGEACDDGNTENIDGCTNVCALPFCGDGIVSRWEGCDEGIYNGKFADACRPNCKLPICGDGIPDSNEYCDDGNRVATDGCSNTCLLGVDVVCADASECFSGICSEELCRVAGICGNGKTEEGESCDDGNDSSDDACSPDCRRTEDQACEEDEQCESTLCAGGLCVRSGICGDGRIDKALGEECDQGPANSDLIANRCRTTCLLAKQGDGVKDSGEQCDDGNQNDKDGCTRAGEADQSVVAGAALTEPSQTLAAYVLSAPQNAPYAIAPLIDQQLRGPHVQGRLNDTGPAALAVMAAGAAAGYAGVRRRRR